MIHTYFKIAWRNIRSNKIFSIIKISGLALGLTVCMLILLYIKDEVSYDQFHLKKALIMRVVQEMKVGKDYGDKLSITQAPLGSAFKNEIPEIEQYVRLNQSHITLRKGKEVFAEDPLFTDSNFFSVFSFSIIRGNHRNPLEDKHSIVLSEERAKKYFGNGEAIGQVLEVKVNDQFEQFKVTAIVENAPENSTIQYGLIIPYEYWSSFEQSHGWIGGSLNTFLLLSPHAKLNSVVARMQHIYDRNTHDEIAKAKETQGLIVKITLGLQPLTDIHLNSAWGTDNGLENQSTPTYSYILGCIGIFILVIACINFINLAVAQSLKRSKEIGIRKVVGGTRSQLIWQFLMESLLVSLIAFILAIILTSVLLPGFGMLANKKLSLGYLADFRLYIGYFLLLLITAFLAGLYPSLLLSGFKPVRVLYGKQKMLGKNYLTRGLIVLQFTLAIFLIIGTIAVYHQLNFLFHTNLGYESRNLVRIDLPHSKNNDQLLQLYKNALQNNSSIVQIAGRNRGRSITGSKAAGKDLIIDMNKIDEQFFPTLGIPILAGRNFSPDFPSDTSQSVIVNESFVKGAGWTESEAIGKSIKPGDDQKPSMIIGVIRDYHFASLKEKIIPQVFTMKPGEDFGQIWVRIKPADIPRTLSLLERTYKKLSPFYPYSYQFLDDINAKNYESEMKWKQIITVAALLFIAVSCMGLFGLVILSVEQRTKEIGIRKVLGAASMKIAALISSDFLRLITLAFLIAAPFGYWAISKWLQQFAYRIDIEWWIFPVSWLAVMALALGTIGFKAIGAAMANPVKSLRTE